MPLMNFTQYGKHRGVTQQAVSFAVQEGRIKVVLDSRGRRLIDSDQADKDWDANTNYATHPDKLTTKEKREIGAAQAPDTDRKGPPSITESKAIKEAYLARTAKLEYERLAGKTVNIEEANKEWLRVAVAVKTKMLGVPSKLKGKLEHLSLDDIATIEDVIREALSDLADNRGLL